MGHQEIKKKKRRRNSPGKTCFDEAPFDEEGKAVLRSYTKHLVGTWRNWGIRNDPVRDKHRRKECKMPENIPWGGQIIRGLRRTFNSKHDYVPWRAFVRRGCIHPGISFSVTFPDDKCLRKAESRGQGCSSAQVVWETSEIFRWRCQARNSIYIFGTPAKEMDYVCMAEWQPQTTSHGDHGSGIHKGHKAKPVGSPQHTTTNPEANYKRKNPQRKVSRKNPRGQEESGHGEVAIMAD